MSQVQDGARVLLRDGCIERVRREHGVEVVGSGALSSYSVDC